MALDAPAEFGGARFTGRGQKAGRSMVDLYPPTIFLRRQTASMHIDAYAVPAINI
jgi:hypothetical protein